MLFHLLYGALGRHDRLPARVPLPVDAHPRRGDHRAAAVVLASARGSSSGSSRARSASTIRDRRPADPQEEGRHADDGRLADPVLPRRLDAAVVRPAQPLRAGSRSRSPSRSARSASPTTTRRSPRRTRRASAASCACCSSSRSPAARWRTCSTRTRCRPTCGCTCSCRSPNFYEQRHRRCRAWLYATFGAFVVVGTANAVNLTDGLDGLAIGPSIMNAGTFLVLAYIAGVPTTMHRRGGARGHDRAVPPRRAHPRRRGARGVLRPRCSAPASASSGTTPTPRRCSWATSARCRSAARSACSRC